jgi:hypothetical protein
MAPVLKTGIPERVSGVRIPPSPPAGLDCKEILPTSIPKYAKGELQCDQKTGIRHRELTFASAVENEVGNRRYLSAFYATDRR